MTDPQPVPDAYRMRRFELHRDEDVSGVSGTGVVAEGVAFSDGGPVALRWTSEWPTSAPQRRHDLGCTPPIQSLTRETWNYGVVFHDRGVESLEAVHGHNGRTRIVWLDEDSHKQAPPLTPREGDIVKGPGAEPWPVAYVAHGLAIVDTGETLFAYALSDLTVTHRPNTWPVRVWLTDEQVTKWGRREFTPVADDLEAACRALVDGEG